MEYKFNIQIYKKYHSSYITSIFNIDENFINIKCNKSNNKHKRIINNYFIGERCIDKSSIKDIKASNCFSIGISYIFFVLFSIFLIFINFYLIFYLIFSTYLLYYNCFFKSIKFILNDGSIINVAVYASYIGKRVIENDEKYNTIINFK